MAEINTTKVENETVSETAADKGRREATELNSTPEVKPIEVDCIYYEAIGLDPKNPITEEILNEAFRKKIQTAHPDHAGSTDEAAKVIKARDAFLAKLKKGSTFEPGKRHFSTLRVKEPPRSVDDPRVEQLINAALVRRDFREAQRLVDEEEVHPDSHDAHENTLLAEAAKQGALEVIRFAIDRLGASPDTSCDCPAHRTPLHYAVEKGHVKAVALLLEKNANPNLINSFGETPLDITKGNEEIKTLLIQHGAMYHRSTKRIGFFRSLFGYSSADRTKLLGPGVEPSKVIALPPSKKEK
jgi:hypothetical protein